jgi:hypothetical protein
MSSQCREDSYLMNEWGKGGDFSVLSLEFEKKDVFVVIEFLFSLLQGWKTKNVACECAQAGSLTSWETIHMKTIHMKLERGENSQ